MAGTTGSVIGGILGAVGGAVVGGPPGAAAGYTLGSGVGGAIGAGIDTKKAQDKQIPMSDPNQTSLLNEIIAKRKRLEAGSMYQPQQDTIMQAGAYGMNRAVRATGGDVGSTIKALSLINRGTGRNLNELYGNMMNQSVNMLQLQQAQTQAIENRSLGLQMYDKTQAMGDATKRLSDSKANINSALASKTGQDLLGELIAKRKAGLASEEEINLVQNAIGATQGTPYTGTRAVSLGKGV